MKTKKLTFGRALGDLPQALAQARLAESALRFIDNGMDDPYGSRTTSSVATLGLMVQNRLLEQATGGGIVPDPARMAEAWRKGTWEVAQQDAYKALMAEYVEATARFFGRIPPPWLGLSNDQVEADLAEELCGQAPSDEPNEKEPVKLAYQMATFNRLRCEQRIALLYVLAGVVRPPYMGTLPNAPAQAELEAVTRHLWVNRSLYLSRMLAFGTLLGGEYLERNRELVKGMYGEGMSVIELLQVDGETPGHWQAATEDNLRKAIANA